MHAAEGGAGEATEAPCRDSVSEPQTWDIEIYTSQTWFCFNSIVTMLWSNKFNLFFTSQENIVEGV